MNKIRTMKPSKTIESPSQFVVPISDEHNPSARVEFRIHPGFAREGAELFKPGVERGAPWKTQDDCERWIFKCGLERAGELLGASPVGGTAAFELFMQEAELEFEVSYTRDRIEKIRRILEERQRIGMNKDSMEQFLRAAWRSINQIKYPHWRQYLLREFERQFGHMMPRTAAFRREDMEIDGDRD